MIPCPTLPSSPSPAPLIIRPRLPPLLIECVVGAMRPPVFSSKTTNNDYEHDQCIQRQWKCARFVFLIFLVRPLLRERGFLFHFLGLALSQVLVYHQTKAKIKWKYQGRSQLLLR
jgi:hypothetical protein